MDEVDEEEGELKYWLSVLSLDIFKESGDSDAV